MFKLFVYIPTHDDILNSAHQQPTTILSSNTSTTTTTVTTTSKTKHTCFDLLRSGKWSGWQDHGFERQVKNSAGEYESIRDPLDERFPNAPPPFREWTRQNYTGTWVGDSNCDLVEIHSNHIAKCIPETNRISMSVI